MTKIQYLPLLAIFLFSTAFGQNSKKFLPNKYGDICPLWNSFSVGSARYIEFKNSPNTLPNIIPEKDRRSCSNFGASDFNGEVTTIDNCKGNIVVIGFWGTECNPSTKMLEEFRNAQDQVKASQLKVIFWPVHFEIWPVVNSFTIKNKNHLGDLKVKKIGVGNNGLSNLVDTLDGLPTIFIVDKHGRISTTWSGFREQLLFNQLNKLIHEN